MTPTWNPPAASDRRAAWEGEYPGLPGVPLRVEAAAYRGRPVYFYTIGPWTRPRMMQAYKPSTGEKLSAMSWILVLVTTFCVGAYLARRNLRLGRGDRRGASRFATAVFAISAAAWIFGGTHVAAAAELALIVMRVGWSLFLAGAVWMVYVAVEPYVRKYWPGVLIGWSRLLAGRWRDPLVGRDILVGVVFVAVGASVSQMPGTVSHLLGIAAPIPAVQSDLALMGLRGVAATFMIALLMAVLLSTTGLFLMFLLRRVLRLQWLAAAAFVALVVLNSAESWGTANALLPLICEHIGRVSDRHRDHAFRFSGLCVGRGAGPGLRDLPRHQPPVGLVRGPRSLRARRLPHRARLGHAHRARGSAAFLWNRFGRIGGFMTRRLLLAFGLATALALPLCAQEGFSPFTTDFPPEEFAARRAKVYDAIGDKAFAVIQGAPSTTGYTRFRQSNDFYYLCGIEVPRAYLLLDGQTRQGHAVPPAPGRGPRARRGPDALGRGRRRGQEALGRRRRVRDGPARRADGQPVPPPRPARSLHAPWRPPRAPR